MNYLQQPKANCIVLNGSSRIEGDTKKMITTILNLLNIPKVPIVDLCTLDITPYDYSGKNINDDFIPLIESCVASYPKIVLATPIYWYTVSSYIKIFLDRLTDLLTLRKDLQHGLEGKSLAIIGTFAGKNEAQTKMIESHIDHICSGVSSYLKMHYTGSYFTHCSLGNINKEKLQTLFFE